MTRSRSFSLPLTLVITCAAVIGVASQACKKKESATEPGAAAQTGKKTTIQNIGSDTMVNLAQAWAEQYAKVDPSVSVEVAGGGSGIGVAALINGPADGANASRKLEPAEVEKIEKAGHKDPIETTVGYDAL